MLLFDDSFCCLARNRLGGYTANRSATKAQLCYVQLAENFLLTYVFCLHQCFPLYYV